MLITSSYSHDARTIIFATIVGSVMHVMSVLTAVRTICVISVVSDISAVSVRCVISIMGVKVTTTRVIKCPATDFEKRQAWMTLLVVFCFVLF